MTVCMCIDIQGYVHVASCNYICQKGIIYMGHGIEMYLILDIS